MAAGVLVAAGPRLVRRASGPRPLRRGPIHGRLPRVAAPAAPRVPPAGLRPGQALELARRGLHLVLVGRSPGKLARTCEFI